MADAILQSEYQILFNKAQQAISAFFAKFESTAENAGTKGVNQMENSFNSLPNRMNRIFDITFGNVLAGAIQKGVQTASGILANGFDSAINFEKQISSISALTGASIDQIAKIKSVSLQLGKETKFSALEAAQGFEELLKSGLSLDQVLNGGLAGSLALAAAGQVTVKEASEIASTALNTFSADNLTTAQAADILAGAANASATDILSIKFSLSAVGSVAALAGQSFKDTATAIALFANNGLKGADAGTSLKTLLNNLVPTTKRAKETMQDLGLTTNEVGNNFLNADGSFKDLRDISQELFIATKDLSESQRSLALETIFGSDAIRAGALLAKGGAKSFDELAKNIDKVKAADVAKERLKNLSGVIETLSGTIETLNIEVISPFLPLITRLGNAFNDALGSINVGNSISNFAKAINDLNFESLANSIKQTGTLLGNVFTNIQGSDTTKAIINDLSLSFGLLSQLIKPVIAPLGEFFEMLSKNQLIVEATVISITAIITALGVLAGISAVTSTIASITAAGTAIIAIFNPISLLIGAIVAFGLAYQTNFGGFATFINSLLPIILSYFNTLGAVIQNISTTVLPFFSLVFLSVSKVFQALLFPLGIIIANLAFFGIQIFTIAQLAIAVLNPAIENIKVAISGLTTAFIPLFQQAIIGFNQLKVAIDPVLSVLSFGLGIALNGLLGTFNLVFPLILGVFIRVFEAIGTIIVGSINIFTGFINIVTGIFTGDFNRVILGFQNIFAGLGNYLLASIQLITSPFRGIIDGIGTLFQSFDLFRIGVNLVQGLINGIKNNIGGVTNAISGGIRNAIEGAKKLLGIQSPSKVFFEIGGFTAKGLELGINKAIPNVKNAFDNLLTIPEVPKIDLTNLSRATSSNNNGTNSVENSNNNTSYNDNSNNTVENINYGSSGNSFRIKTFSF